MLVVAKNVNKVIINNVKKKQDKKLYIRYNQYYIKKVSGKNIPKC